MTAQLEASDSLIRRIRIMAEFIRNEHRDEFSAYWAANFPGKARADETLDFFAQPDLVSLVALHRKVYL